MNLEEEFITYQYFCDACKKEIKTNGADIEKVTLPVIDEDKYYTHDDEFELCPDCYNKVCNFMQKLFK